MSVLIVPNDAKKRLMSQVAAIGNPPDKLKLYQNNYTPVPGTLAADLTEATFTGYAQATLNGPAVAGALDGSNRAVLTYDPATFTKSGATGNTIYGYWVTDSADDLLWVERFDAPISMTVDGAFITITPKFTGMSQFSNT